MFFNMLPHKARQDKALAVLQGQTMKVIEARRDELQSNNITCLPSDTETGEHLGRVKTNYFLITPLF